MHARKIALHRKSLIAIVMTLLVLGSALAIAGNSTAITPQKGTVTYQAVFLSGTSTPLPASGAKVTVSTTSGYQVTTLSGAVNSVSLPYGSYVFKMQPYVSSAYVVNGVSKLVNVTSSTNPTVYLNTTASHTHKVAVTVSGINPGTSATVSFSTASGFVFETNTTSGSFNASLPANGFLATVNYDSQSNTTYQTGIGSSLLLGTPGTNIVGGIVTSSNGQSVGNFNVIAIDKAANYYTVTPFTGGAFAFVKNTGVNYVISANGYAPVDYTSQTSIVLHKASSNVTYNYTLGKNPSNVYMNVTYSVGNSTALPFLPNATIGSLYWQLQFDHLTTTALFQKEANPYLSGLAGAYSDYSILVNGYNYKKTSTTIVSAPSLGTGTNTMSAKVDFVLHNSNVTASSLANGFSTKLYAKGTQYNTGSLYYNYAFSYNVSGLSLSSPVSKAKTFVSPVKLLPQSSNGFVDMVFSKVSSPIVTASQINLFWNGTTPSDYLVASNSTSAAFIVPTHTAVSFNLSNAFYNPVTHAHDYANALNYTWKLGNTVQTNDYNMYNATITFGSFANYTVTVQYTSSSGETNTTSFSVFAYNAAPSASLNVTSQGNTLFASNTVTGTQSISVPQSKTVQFSAYQSNLVIPGTSYKVPLLYNWYFPGYTNAAMNVTQTFNTPYIASQSMVTGYLNVATAVGSAANITLSLKVLDTTPASPVVTLSNATGASITQPVAGKLVVFSANKTTDKYYSQSQLTYSWNIVYSNGTKVAPGNSTYELMNNNTNLSYFSVKFNTLNSLIVSLEVKNPSNVSAYNNFTASIAVDSPRLIVQNAYFPTTPSQGSKTLIYLNVSNNGTVDASSFSIAAYVNGKNVSFQSYGALPVGVTKQFEFNLTSPTSGNVQIVFKAMNNSQPSFFSDSGQLSVTHNVSPPGYQTPLIIGGVIAVIVVIGFVYYRLSSRGPSKPKAREKKPVPKKTEEKKK